MKMKTTEINFRSFKRRKIKYEAKIMNKIRRPKTGKNNSTFLDIKQSYTAKKKKRIK